MLWLRSNWWDTSEGKIEIRRRAHAAPPEQQQQHGWFRHRTGSPGDFQCFYEHDPTRHTKRQLDESGHRQRGVQKLLWSVHSRLPIIFGIAVKVWFANFRAGGRQIKETLWKIVNHFIQKKIKMMGNIYIVLDLTVFSVFIDYYQS